MTAFSDGYLAGHQAGFFEGVKRAQAEVRSAIDKRVFLHDGTGRLALFRELERRETARQMQREDVEGTVAAKLAEDQSAGKWQVVV